MNTLENEIKELIIESLNLEDVSIDDIDSNAPLFGEGLGLDSIDSLELGLSIYQKYKVKFDTESGDNKKHFESVASLAKYINAKRKT